MPKARNLKYCRTKAGLTQQALADEIGVSKVSVSSWETLRTAIPVPTTKRIANYFGVTYSDFCNEDLEKLDTEFCTPIQLSAIERKNMMLFRELPDEVKDTIRSAIILSHKLMKGDRL